MTRVFRRPILAALTGILLLAPALEAQSGTAQNFCWQQSTTRSPQGGTGCPPGQVLDPGGLCYSPCPSGSTGVADYCWPSCSAPFTDEGAICGKPKELYTSAGYASSRACGNGWGVGCYKNASLWYPYCPSGYVSHGLLDCSPACPAGTTDGGATCTKVASFRGYGTVPPACPSGTELDGGICYPTCASGFTGIGPVCWGNCQGSHPVQCGAACASSQAACDQAVGQMVLSTSAVALNILSFAFGGPGVTTAVEKAAAAGEGAAFDQILTHTATNWVSMVAGVGKSYALAYGKQFVKTTLKNSFDERNMFWTFTKQTNSGALKALNDSTNQYGTLKTAPATSSFDMNTLVETAESIDPTGLANLITSFTKYGKCSGGEDLVPSPNELNFGSTAKSAIQQSFTITANQSFTILRFATAAFTNMTITPSLDCIGKQIQTGKTCNMSVTVSGPAQLDAELRIYTDHYPTVPITVHLLANSGSKQPAVFIPGQESINLASIVGAWNVNGQKSVINFDGKGTGAFSGQSASVYDAARRLILITDGWFNTRVYYVDDAAENLLPYGAKLASFNASMKGAGSGSFLAVPGNSSQSGTQLVESAGSPQIFNFIPQSDNTFQIGTDTGQVLDISAASTADGAPLIQWPVNGGSNQRFFLQPVADGNVRIVNLNSGDVLAASPGSLAMVQTPWTGDSSQEFSLSGTPAVAAYSRLPWGAGCQPGDTNFDNLCYSVDQGYAMTTPGIEGKICPTDWRDDGTTCWPPWTGVAVGGQADPNPSPADPIAYTLRHPLVVTSCSSYAASNNQACPANFQNVGGPGSCSCQAEGTSKNIKSISSTLPSN